MTFIEEEEKEQMLMSTPAEEEHTVKMLTPWEKELEDVGGLVEQSKTRRWTSSRQSCIS
jgi:hypothetical protein